MRIVVGGVLDYPLAGVLVNIDGLLAVGPVLVLEFRLSMRWVT